MNFQSVNSCLLRRGRLHPADAAGFHLFQLLAGEVKLNSIAAALLAQCDGIATRGEIIAKTLRTFAAVHDTHPLHAFLDAAIRNAWVVELPQREFNALTIERRI